MQHAATRLLRLRGSYVAKRRSARTYEKERKKKKKKRMDDRMRGASALERCCFHRGTEEIEKEAGGARCRVSIMRNEERTLFFSFSFLFFSSRANRTEKDELQNGRKERSDGELLERGRGARGREGTMSEQESRVE